MKFNCSPRVAGPRAKVSADSSLAYIWRNVWRSAWRVSAATALLLLVFIVTAVAQDSTSLPASDTSTQFPSALYGSLDGSSQQSQSSSDQADEQSAVQQRRAKAASSASTLQANTPVTPESAADDASAFMTDRIIDIFEQRPELIAPVRKSVIARLQALGENDRAQEMQQDSTEDGFYREIEQDADVRMLVVQDLRRRGYGNENVSDADDASLAASAQGSQLSSLRRRQAAAQDMRSQRRRPTDDTDASQSERLISRPSPYPSLPSLRDLYEQIPRPESRLKRFGSEIFKNGTGNTDQLPMDLPIGPDYVLGPGDTVILNLSGSISRRLPRTIDPQGQIALPEAGTMIVAGQTIAHATELIQKRLATQYRDVSVELSLSRLRTVRVYVVGDVQRPGAYDISSLSSPLNALFAAGGPTAEGSLRILRHYRGKEQIKEIDLYDFLLRGIRSDDGQLQSGDTLLVPPVGPQVYVSGMVRRPAIYELNSEETLDQVLQLAGGVLVSASMGQITVERTQAHEHRTMLSVRISKVSDKVAVDKALSSFAVEDGDRIYVQPILPYARKTVYLQGHVFRPGKYSYHDGETVNDLLKSYQDLLPEPADHAEIVRLEGPELRPVTIPFKLSDILIGDDPIELKPFDVIRVYGRYEADPPKVYVYGEVLRPGEYPLSQDMTAAGLVQMAGGFKRSAFRQEADLSSYVVKDGQKILTKHGTINILEALNGDKSADARLKPGDVVTIRQLTGWNDIGASVTVNGEVLYAGKYGIQEGERLSSVLRRAGGFRATAYPSGAVLERVQVKQMAEKTRTELIRRIQAESMNVKTPGNTSGGEALAFSQAMQAQEQQVVASLKATPPSGRLVIHISSDISKWQNTPADVEMRAGDVLVIPKRPDFVLVNGQVYNPAAISFAPGKDADWYVRQAGGPTQLANTKAMFIVRADGSVLGKSSGGFWSGGVKDARLQPGDSVVIPDKIMGGSVVWKNLLTWAQLASSAAVTTSIATHF
jgi:protein involved in polysaccharide export with SLBB domain